MMNYDSSTSKAELSRRNSFSQNKSEKVMLEHRIRQEYAQNEIAVKKFQAGKHKTNVLYGQIIQLKHLGTGKWLQGNTYTADKEHDCLRLGLSEGDENCHFRIMPRFRIRREGSMAYFGDMLHLHSEKLPGYSIRVTEEVRMMMTNRIPLHCSSHNSDPFTQPFPWLTAFPSLATALRHP